MKKIMLVVSMFLVFAGVATASSINGNYKGNPIVLITSQGLSVPTGDVPAMIYDGSTMVPIAVLRQFGFDVIWNADTYSVEVHKRIPAYTYSNAVQELGFPANAILTVDAKNLAIDLLQIRKTKSVYDYSVYDALTDLGFKPGDTPTLASLQQAVRLISIHD